MTSKIVKKTLEEAQGVPNAEIDFSDKSLVHMDDMTRLWWVSSTLFFYFNLSVYLHINQRSLLLSVLFKSRTLTWTIAQILSFDLPFQCIVTSQTVAHLV